MEITKRQVKQRNLNPRAMFLSRQGSRKSREEESITSKSISQAGDQNCVDTMSGRWIYKVMGFHGRIFVSALILSV